MEQRLGALQSMSKTARDHTGRVLLVNTMGGKFKNRMGYAVVVLLFVVAVAGEQVLQDLAEPEPIVDLADTDLVLAFVVFRHGDRTPDDDELELFSYKFDESIFFPYGMKALTNKGKQRAYEVGEYIRGRYDGFISKLYLPDEFVIRTTEYARTKMSALAAVAAIYPPPPAQKWNPTLDWQPVPYDTMPFAEDDMSYWYNCPRYLWLRDCMYKRPELVTLLQPYSELFTYISKHTGTNVTTAEQIFFLDNILQALDNVKLKPPKWAQDVMPQIKAMTKIEYVAQTLTNELKSLAAGVWMTDFVNATNRAIAGDMEQPKLRVYSGHENNVATMMAAAGVFDSHQPSYGATFSLELRRHQLTGRYGIAAVYQPITRGPEEVLKIKGCGDVEFCDYETFVKLMESIMWSREDFAKACPRMGACPAS